MRQRWGGHWNYSVLADAIRACRQCPLADTRTQAVPAWVGPDYRLGGLAFMAEAPGRQEDETGIPLVGSAGRIFDRVLAEAGISRSSLLLMNTVRCRPPSNNLASVPIAKEKCAAWTAAEMAEYRPAKVVLLGGTAAATIFGKAKRIGEVRGTLRAVDGVVYTATYHPASALPNRSPENAAVMVEDVRSFLL